MRGVKERKNSKIAIWMLFSDGIQAYQYSVALRSITRRNIYLATIIEALDDSSAKHQFDGFRVLHVGTPDNLHGVSGGVFNIRRHLDGLHDFNVHQAPNGVVLVRCAIRHKLRHKINNTTFVVLLQMVISPGIGHVPRPRKFTIGKPVAIGIFP
jgi:hypothetical protein